LEVSFSRQGIFPYFPRFAPGYFSLSKSEKGGLTNPVHEGPLLDGIEVAGRGIVADPIASGVFF
jgi:hypothetical protein